MEKGTPQKIIHSSAKKIAEESSIEAINVDKIMDDVKESTFSTIDPEKGDVNDLKKVSTMGLPSFIIQDNGIYIDPENQLLNPSSFRTFLNLIFQNGQYLKNIQYKNITDILYNSESKNIHLDAKKVSPIKIASSIETFAEQRKALYREPLISPDKKSASYNFGTVYLNETDNDDRIKDIIGEINIDEFIAFMWTRGIQYGLDIETITKAIGESTPTRIIIAKNMEPVQGKAAMMEPVISFEINRGVKDTLALKTDVLVYSQSFIRVEENIPIYRKRPPENGRHGWSIDGSKIEPEKPTDLHTESLAGDGVYKLTIQGIDYLISSYSGFPRREEIIATRDGVRQAILSKLHVDKNITLVNGVGMSTGKVTVREDLCSLEDIVLDTKCRHVIAKCDVEANIDATEDILVEGSVRGTTQSSLLTHQHQRTTVTSKGKLVSSNGGIIVKGYVENACLEARNGSIQVKNITNSIVKAKRVEVSGDVFNCTIIADEIIIHGFLIETRLISGKSIIAKKSTRKNFTENTFCLFSVDLTLSIEKNEELLKKEIKSMEDMENTIDTLFTAVDFRIAKYMSDRDKRLRLTKIFIEMMDLLDGGREKYKEYFSLFNLFKPALIQIYKKHDTLLTRFKKATASIEKLRKDIEIEKKSMNESQKNLSLEIHEILGTTLVYWIQFPENKQLLDLPMSMTNTLLESVTGKITSKMQSITSINSPRHGGFSWKCE